MKPEVRVFSKDAPCTKVEIWNCFRARSGFVSVQVVQAHSEIGLNVPRVMERNARLTRAERKGIEYYILTPEGEEWLLAGIRAFLKNHPLRADEVAIEPPSDKPARLRRTR